MTGNFPLDRVIAFARESKHPDAAAAATDLNGLRLIELDIEDVRAELVETQERLLEQIKASARYVVEIGKLRTLLKASDELARVKV